MSLTKVPSAMTELTGTTFNGEVRSYDSADQANFVGGVSGTANRIQIRGASHPSAPNVMTMDLGSGEVLRYTTTTKTEFGYPSFNCRAWVNFNGTGTVAIRGSGNVSSITDNGTGNYTVNFTTAMPDTNYSCSLSGSDIYYGIVLGSTVLYTGSMALLVCGNNNTIMDATYVYVSIHR